MIGVEEISDKDFLQRSIIPLSKKFVEIIRESFPDAKMAWIGKPSEKNNFLYKRNEVYYAGDFLYTRIYEFYEGKDEWIFIAHGKEDSDNSIIEESYYKCDSDLGLKNYIKSIKVK